jgi:hypothetical protein
VAVVAVVIQQLHLAVLAVVVLANQVHRQAREQLGQQTLAVVAVVVGILVRRQEHQVVLVLLSFVT